MIDRRNTQFGLVLVAHQLRRGAAMKKAGAAAIERATANEGLPLLVADFEDTDRVVGAAGPDSFVAEVESKAVDGYIKIGGQQDWMQNIVSHAMEGRVYPGLNDGW